MLIAGAFGYGGSVMVQNAGIGRTSVTHAALLIGAVPVLVAIIAAVWYRAVARPVAWFGFAVSLGGVGLVTTGSGGGGATLAGDGLVLASLLLSATVTVAQGRLLAGRDPIAVILGDNEPNVSAPSAVHFPQPVNSRKPARRHPAPLRGLQQGRHRARSWSSSSSARTRARRCTCTGR